MLNNCYSVYKAEILPWKCCAVFRRRSSTVSSASAHSNTSLLPYRWVLWHSAVNAFCERPAQNQSLRCTGHTEQDQCWLVVLQETVWLWKAGTERNRDRCTNLGILFSEEVNEAKTTVGSTDPFLWQTDCLQLSKRTDKKKQHLHFGSDLTWLFYKNYKGTKSKTTILP